MDLFRHTTQLGYHSESALGYAHWVLTTLLDPRSKKDPLYTYTIENMHAVSVAMDVTNWYLGEWTVNGFIFGIKLIHDYVFFYRRTRTG